MVHYLSDSVEPQERRFNFGRAGKKERMMPEDPAISEPTPPPQVTAPSQSETPQPAAAKQKGRKLDAQLPYLAAPGSIKTALERIRAAATPDRVTSDFISTKLQMKGGQGAAVGAFLKKIGLVGSDGIPTKFYRSFRNQATGGAAIAEAIKYGYKALADVNEYFYELDDKGLRGLIVQVTGSEPESSVTKLTVATLKALKAFASFDTTIEESSALQTQIETNGRHTEPQNQSVAGIGLNLAYTINLNLPATSDQAVFNAIFKSLKEHLLSND